MPSRSLLTDCNIFSSYLSCFSLLVDTSWFKINDGSSPPTNATCTIYTNVTSTYEAFSVILTAMLSAFHFHFSPLDCSTRPPLVATAGWCSLSFYLSIGRRDSPRGFELSPYFRDQDHQLGVQTCVWSSWICCGVLIFGVGVH